MSGNDMETEKSTTSEDDSPQKRGHMRLVNSDTTVRPMRHVSDTKNCFSATTVAASSYESGTSGPSRGRTRTHNARVWYYLAQL